MVRIGHEAQLYDASVCATLTYDDAHMPASLSLEYRHFQLFLKRLRKRVEGADRRRPIRFFMCGEYGTESQRPHYHAILFNAWFPDQRLYGRYYRSELATEIWQNGHVVLDRVTPAVASYVAGYVTVKQKRAFYEDSVVDLGTGELSDRRPEFIQMSRRPGIGGPWYDQFGADLFPFDKALSGGKCWKVPRFYSDKYFGSADGLSVEAVKEARYERARVQLDAGESTPERRAVREEVLERRTGFYSPRGL